MIYLCQMSIYRSFAVQINLNQNNIIKKRDILITF
jgi:hypothetical protein